jgi:hypothetical protein
MEDAEFSPKTVLVCLDPYPSVDVLDMCQQFCGKVITNLEEIASFPAAARTFLIGDVQETLTALSIAVDVTCHDLFAVREYSRNYDTAICKFVSYGQVPRFIPGIGVYYPEVFDGDKFKELVEQHEFCTLTESDKPSTGSYRKGVYITRVTPADDGSSEFKLLRCSTNFKNPTENQRPVDDGIINTLNGLARLHYDGAAEFNHVLAQVYTNVVAVADGKEKKARIPAHSDKTKDMPRNALIAFVTFYDFDAKVKDTYTREGWDLKYRDTSVLTRLVWKEKGEGQRVVSLPLFPNSVLFVSMDTNRTYCHEIRPSTLPICKLPTRIGYVVRCSKTTAVHHEGRTSIIGPEGIRVEMRQPAKEDMQELKAQYWRENATREVISYTSASHGDLVPYSMNAGDYMLPRL